MDIRANIDNLDILSITHSYLVKRGEEICKYLN